VDAAVQLSREHGWTRLAVDALRVARGTGVKGPAKHFFRRPRRGGGRGAQVVRLDTYAHSPVSVPFYEEHMGYRRRSIIFQKRL
jgi:hypothetical protein